jgi:hypothetical protein
MWAGNSPGSTYFCELVLYRCGICFGPAWLSVSESDAPPSCPHSSSESLQLNPSRSAISEPAPPCLPPRANTKFSLV